MLLRKGAVVDSPSARSQIDRKDQDLAAVVFLVGGVITQASSQFLFAPPVSMCVCGRERCEVSLYSDRILLSA